MHKILGLSNKIFLLKLDCFRDGINKANQVADIRDKYLALRPFHLNVIEAACHGRFKETGHSLILANMLRHPLIQSSFLKKFLSIQHDYLTVTAEKDRVDVALKGKDLFVIVENKVNGAEERENQVYRYVHKIGIEKHGYNISQIYVVYLNPYNRQFPSDYSLCDENGENNVFDSLGEDHYTVQSYKHDITNWLRKISIDNEPHIGSALDQYIDFLEQKFQTSPLDKSMNEEIKNLIIKELQIEDKPFDEQMKVLNNQYDKVKNLLNQIDNIKTDIRKSESHRIMLEWQKQIEKQLGIKLAQDDHSFGIQLRNKVWLGIWDGYDDDHHLPYWGFQMDSTYRKDIPEFDSQLEEILIRADIEKKKHNEYFYAWYTTGNGVKRFISLYNSVKESHLI